MLLPRKVSAIVQGSLIVFSHPKEDVEFLPWEMFTYASFAATVLTVVSITTAASATTQMSTTSRRVSSEEGQRCQLDEAAVYQLHEIRTERKQSRLMLQNIEGVSNQLTNNARRQLQNRLVRLDRAEEFVLSKSCDNLD